MKKQEIKIKKWKCRVCGFIMEAEEHPKKCVMCKTEAHKIKELRYGKRSKSGLEIAESED